MNKKELAQMINYVNSHALGMIINQSVEKCDICHQTSLVLIGFV